ncbi:class I SAM-dependent methyltransferase [Desulfitobacterium sp. Sab5]|uniref:class I SAM-dependent methyltransferase n=1 Tax=Desulfitobacterium nosdiversum TaxID=3375356 RepID=UPI003CF202F0
MSAQGTYELNKCYKEKKSMELSPRLYHWFVRPKFFTQLYINNLLQNSFDFRNKTILDFGCGIGSSSSIFDSNHYLGVDPDFHRVAYAKRLYPTYRFDVFDGKNLFLKQGSFDYIIMVAVLHHIPSDGVANYLTQLKRILKPFGQILVIEPCLAKNLRLSNSLMRFLDNGPYIRDSKGYIEIFKTNQFKTKIHKQYRRFFYHEIFFSAILN